MNMATKAPGQKNHEPGNKSIWVDGERMKLATKASARMEKAWKKHELVNKSISATWTEKT